MIDWLRGPSALRRAGRWGAWLPSAAVPCAAPPTTGASGAAGAPMAACRALLPEPPEEAAGGLPAEQPAASRHAPAARTPAQVAGLREMVLRGASAVMPMGRRYRRRGSPPMVTTWHRCYLAREACRPAPTGFRPRPPSGPPAPG